MEAPLKLALFAAMCGLLGAIPTYFMDFNCGQTIDFTSKGIYDMRLKLTALSSYRPNMQCSLTLVTRNNSYFMLYFRNLQIESTIGCGDDWLEVHDGPTTKTSPYVSGLSGRQCGYGIGDSVYTTKGRYLTLFFESDGQFGLSGFDMILTPYHVGSCYSDEYRCHNGRCISDHSTCNGYNPCGDNSDCSLAAGAIAGIVIGTLIGFSLCIAFVVVCRRRRRHAYNHVTAVVTPGGGYGTPVAGYSQPVQQPYPTGPAYPPPSYQ